ncbi:MAG TPA: dihydrodipicolinate synthase family protein [Terriglobia bacterium]|nr:dihydrodipicolinate synthase family protein [Terriglobia bacterium]
MQTRKPLEDWDRRAFLQLLGIGALGLAVPGWKILAAEESGSKPLRGIFPVAQTPFTESNKLDLDALIEEVRFIDRGGVHGFVWPQMASEWMTLSEAERLEGSEAVASTGKNLRPAIVIGVQASNTSTAIKYAKHAERVGADAIISLPPSETSDAKTDLEYYKAVGAATQLPMFVQAVGNMSVDLLIEMYKAIPTFRYVKDEAGSPLMSVGPLRERSSDQVKVFSGSHGRDLIDEMRRGFSGCMPAAPFADLYAQTWDLWHEGKHDEALAMHARTLLILTEMLSHGPESVKYVLCLRGVFKTYRLRTRQSPGFSSAAKLAAGGDQPETYLDEEGKQALRETLDYLKPYLRA